MQSFLELSSNWSWESHLVTWPIVLKSFIKESMQFPHQRLSYCKWLLLVPFVSPCRWFWAQNRKSLMSWPPKSPMKDHYYKGTQLTFHFIGYCWKLPMINQAELTGQSKVYNAPTCPSSHRKENKAAFKMRRFYGPAFLWLLFMKWPLEFAM